jgi:hypothetical protein
LLHLLGGKLDNKLRLIEPKTIGCALDLTMEVSPATFRDIDCVGAIPRKPGESEAASGIAVHRPVEAGPVLPA